MSTASDTAVPQPPPPPAPSVFISYASEDRAAARTLRETLSAAGLDVWYDEEELTGGDAWDQKIRRQIRDCDYFMPIVSATTESRKEGYQIFGIIYLAEQHTCDDVVLQQLG